MLSACERSLERLSIAGHAHDLLGYLLQARLRSLIYALAGVRGDGHHGRRGQALGRGQRDLRLGVISAFASLSRKFESLELELLVEGANGHGHLGGQHGVGRVDQVGRELLDASLAFLRCGVQIQVLGVVLQLSLYWKDIRAQLKLVTIRPQKVFKREFGLTNAKLGVFFVFGRDILIAIVEIDLDYMCSKEFSEKDGVVETQKEDMLVHELDEGLLRLVQGSERLTVYEFHYTVDRLVSMFSLIRNVFACKQVDLQWIQFLPEKLTKQRIITHNLEVQVVQLHQLKLVECPCELYILCGWEQHARYIYHD